ncbi:thiamine-phosphate kinase [Kangiella koreensis]|uniref:Thiamine-monophosphate kinase n=1 Tax=Kangiella koreensis (strain DSM 16069 / JCM 12317 / KCTC 12182 / SW-125) TaxID=523791 RepID=C7R8N3_KANKD|nr:thiamine-phosphate kinase [Kangiella koreensis]ACV25896.1 thiamine-monophosphate kinase [Kangiella koreensis DSM 16069]
MKEFELIKEYFSFSQSKSDTVVEGIGDDCAVLSVPDKRQLVTSVDTLVDGVHFFSDSDPADIAYKSLAVNVSDLAAMGAKPLGFTLAIALPKVDEVWLKSFSKGLQEASADFEIPLIGGDTTQGPLTITVNVLGSVKADKAMLRKSAQLDDDIWVTGYVGDAAAALGLHGKAQSSDLNEAESYLLQRLLRPNPPITFATKLAKLAHAAIDISDGLLADLGHILEQSQCSAKIKVGSLPLSEQLIQCVGLEQAREFALNGGDDYELCFTAKHSMRNKILNLAEDFQVNVHRIGTIVEQSDEGVFLMLDGKPYQPKRKGWQHFST